MSEIDNLTEYIFKKYPPNEEWFTESQKLSSESAKKELVRLYCQDRFKEHFDDFVYLLNYRDIGEFHKKQLEIIGQEKTLESHPVRRLWLWARGFFKTSLITEAHSLFLIVNNPDIRILITSFTIDVAKKPLGAIRNHFTNNEGFRHFFKEFCPIANKDGKIDFGTTENLTVPNRTKPLKEPTVMVAGIGTNITGLHFDWMKLDDLVNRDSVTNETQIQASKDYYSLLRPIFDNPTLPREDVIGTIYHFNDMHACMRKNDDFQQSFIPVCDESGNFIFKERIPKEKFEEMCNDPSINPYDVQSQYFLNPIDPAQRKFKDEWIKYYDTLPTGLSEYILCDPASSVKKKSDYTVIQRWGIDSENNIYLLDGIRDRLLAHERVSKYIGFARQTQRLKGAKYEVIGGRHGDLENIKDEFLKYRLHITPQETKSTNASKQDRIEQRLVGQFHAGKVFLPRKLLKVYTHDGKSYDFVQEYLLEYRQFPFSEHDDILDCHSQLFDGEFLIKGLKPKETETKEGEFEWWRKLAIESRTRRSYNPLKKKFIFGQKKKLFEIPATKSFR